MSRLFARLNSIIKIASVKNFLWLSSDKVFKLLISLVVGAWTARYLGPIDLGKLNYILAYITILTAISSLGMDSFLVKEMLSSNKEKYKTLGTSFILRLSASVLSIIAVYCILLFSKLDSELYYIYYLMILPVLLSPFELIDIEYQSKLESKKTVLSKNIGYIFGTLLKIYILIIGKKLIWFALIIAIEAIISYSILVISYQVNQDLRKWRFNREKVSYLLQNVWPFTLSSVAIILYMRLDQIMLGNIKGVGSVGQFSAAIKITEIFTFLPIAVSSSYFPALIKAKEQNNDFLNLKMKSYLKMMLYTSLTISAIITIFSKIIIGIIYGEQYLDAVNILIIHVWILIPIFIGVVSNQYLVLQGLNKLILFSTLIGLTCNILLNFILIPRYGAVGAAIATLISQIFSAIVSNLFFKKTRIIFSFFK